MSAIFCGRVGPVQVRRGVHPDDARLRPPRPRRLLGDPDAVVGLIQRHGRDALQRHIGRGRDRRRHGQRRRDRDRRGRRDRPRRSGRIGGRAVRVRRRGQRRRGRRNRRRCAPRRAGRAPVRPAGRPAYKVQRRRRSNSDGSKRILQAVPATSGKSAALRLGRCAYYSTAGQGTGAAGHTKAMTRRHS